MRSNAGMANRQGDVDLRFAQVSAPVNTLAWLGLAWLGNEWSGQYVTTIDRRHSTLIHSNRPEQGERWMVVNTLDHFGIVNPCGLSRDFCCLIH